MNTLLDSSPREALRLDHPGEASTALADFQRAFRGSLDAESDPELAAEVEAGEIAPPTITRCGADGSRERSRCGGSWCEVDSDSSRAIRIIEPVANTPELKPAQELKPAPFRHTRTPRRTVRRQPGRRVRRAASSTGGTDDDPGEAAASPSAGRLLQGVAA